MARMPQNWWTRAAGALLVGGVLLAGAVARADAPAQTVISFETTAVGTLPPGFRTLGSGRWQVERVDGRAALAQLVEGSRGYQLAVMESPRLEHLRAGLRLRVGSGDRAAGLAWRVRDEGNYYAARLDLDEREFVLYKFVRGNRIALESLSDLRLDGAEWHELVIEHVRDRLRVWLNGIPVATERDRSLSGPGMLGPWLPSDSTAYFTDLWYEPLVRD